MITAINESGAKSHSVGDFVLARDVVVQVAVEIAVIIEEKTLLLKLISFNLCLG